MGCSCGTSYEYVIEVVYCGGCGWSGVANQVASAIKAKLPKATIDCRPEDGYTGLLQVYIHRKPGIKERVYSGDKKTTSQQITRIVDQTLKKYEQ